MSDESTLRKQARDAIQAGRVPGRRPDRMWGGSGAGASCTICGKAVEPDEIEFELEFARPNGNGGQRNHHLHSRCYAAWEFERRDLTQNGSRHQEPSEAPSDGAAESTSATMASGHVLPRLANGATITGGECTSYKRGSA